MKFELVSKKWARAIEVFEKKGEEEYKRFMDKNHLNITLIDRCIVGEAHGWKMDYSTAMDKKQGYCKTCDNLGGEFFSRGFIGYPKYIPIPKEFNKVKKRFERHWCRIHSKGVTKKK